jgi:hypothetical protein
MIGDDRNSEDKDLRERFAALRREEEAQAPDFVVLTGRRQRQRVAKLIPISVCLAAILAAAIFLVRPVLQKPVQKPVGAVASITEWKAPTDFLLETPGRELLRNVPAIGDWRDYGQSSGRQKHPQVRKHALP